MPRTGPALLAALLLVAAAPAAAQQPLPDFDGRRALDAPPGAESARAARAARALSPRVVTRPDLLRGGTREVRRLDGFLTGPSEASPEQIVLAFLSRHPGLFGLTERDLGALGPARSSRSIDGVTHLAWQQRAGDVVAFDNELRAHVTADGRLISVGGSPRPGLATSGAQKRFRLTPAAARRVARRGAGLPAGAPVDEPEKVIVSEAGRLVPAWRVVARAPRAVYSMLVDGRNGRLIRRQNLVHGVGRVSVIENYPGAPFGGTPTEQNISRWLTSADRLQSNAIAAFADINGNERADAGEQIPPSGDGDWLYPLKRFTFGKACTRPDLFCTWNHNIARSWRENLASDATNAFYLANSFYDRLVANGFTEAMGNFRRVNAGPDGKDGDPIRVLASSGANLRGGFPRDTNNAFMGTEPDGTPGVLTLLLNSAQGFDTMNGYDAATVYHELTHGLVGRSVIDSEGVVAMSDEGGAMNEGISDWFAFSYLHENGSVPDTDQPGEVRMFVAETPDRSGIRTQPLDCSIGAAASVCPGAGSAGPGGYTYGDYGKVYGEPQVHSDGEIWSETMWDLRSSLIAAHGTAGIERAERLMISALQLSIPFPTFLDMRNALLAADRVTGGVDQARIWSVFAGRGMGFFASTSAESASPVEDFSLPPVPGSPEGTLAGTVTDLVSEKPVAGARVVVSGQMNAWAARTDSKGRFRITGLPVGTYPFIEVIKPGYDLTLLDDVTIREGLVHEEKVTLLRDWSSRHTGARVVGSSGPRESGCRPSGVIDQEPASWASTRSAKGRQVTIKLRRAINVLIFGIDPGVYCPELGLDQSSSARTIVIEVAGANRRFRKIKTASFTREDNFYISAVDPGPVVRNARYVRVRVLRPQGPQRDAADPETSHRTHMGIGEVEVYGFPTGTELPSTRRAAVARGAGAR